MLVHASEISSASNIDGYRVTCPQLFINYCEGLGKDTVAISLNQPYDVQAFSEADAIVAVYGTTSAGLDITESFGGGTISANAAFSPNLTAGVEVILGTFGASGKLPVDIPRYISGTGTYSDEIVYPLGHGLSYDSLVPDPDKQALQTAIEQAEALDLSEFTEASVTAAKEVLAAMNEALADAQNTMLTHKLAQSVVDESTNTLNERMDALMELLVYDTDKSALSAAIDDAMALQEEDYTEDTWAAFAQALADAKAVLEANVDQEQVDAALQALKDAQAALTLRGSEAPEDPQPSEGGENKPDDTETGAATGMGLLAAAFLASAAGVLCLNRRRRTH